MRIQLDKLFDYRNVENSYRGVLLCYVRKQLKRADAKMAECFIPDVYWDSSHNNVPKIQASQFDGMCINMF